MLIAVNNINKKRISIN